VTLNKIFTDKDMLDTTEMRGYGCSDSNMYSLNHYHKEGVKVKPVCGCDPLRDSD
jgi:hypothetical protein